MVEEDQVPEPCPLASFPVTVAIWPKRWNAKSTMPRWLIWPEASIGVSPAELTRPPDTEIFQLIAFVAIAPLRGDIDGIDAIGILR